MPRMGMWFVCLGWVYLSACGVPGRDMSTEEGRQEIYFEVNQLLSEEKCAQAIALIDPVYNSIYTENEARLLRSAAYGCAAGVNFFRNLGQIVNAGGAGGLSNTSFWGTVANIWPSYTGDGKAESAITALNSLFTVLKTGQQVVSTNRVFWNSLNPGSILAGDRILDANVYMFFISLATNGTLGSRYGRPDSSGNQTANLPWTSETTVTSDGCAYAASVLNLLDAVSQIQSLYTGSVLTTLATVSQLQTGLDAGCAAGCGDADCFAAGVSCTTCPSTLKNPSSCTGAANDVNSCAAAGLIAGVNAAWP